jgi:RNA polymerase sigma-70 factor (ECF subfamily)
MMESPADSALMLRFQDGDTGAFEILYNRHRGPLYRYFIRQVARVAVDDLFQEVWLRVIRGHARYRATAPFPAYLYRIAHNVLVDHYRRRGREAELCVGDPPDTADPAAGPDRQYTQAELRTRIAAALEDLPAAQREVFLLHEEAGLTLEQIASVVGTGRETVKSRLRYALSKLRLGLANDEPLVERQA